MFFHRRKSGDHLMPDGERSMKPRITVLTLGVADLERSLAFYRDGLGLPTEGIVGREFAHGAVAFFDLAGGLKLGIWAQDDLAHDSGLPKTPVSSSSCSIGHNVARREEVDAVMAQARCAGATIVKPAAETFYGGYAGYFSDPDGHLWEVVWNPANLPRDA
jgi:catechol 2,3-dioxygenase-like lactoylglutathione lyase family enzyme